MEDEEGRTMSVKEMRKAMMAKKKAMKKDPFGDAMLAEAVMVAAPRVNVESERLKDKETKDTVRISSANEEKEFDIPRTAACHSGLLHSLFGRQADDDDDDMEDPLRGEAFPIPYSAAVLDACFTYAMEVPACVRST
jgi:hypothetical protein